MTITQTIKSALKSLWANKTRSFLTMLGIIIGISSVASLMAIGQGVKTDVAKQIKGLGSNLLIILPGQFDTGSHTRGGPNPSTLIGGNILTEEDLKTVRENDKVEAAAPMMIVSATLKYQDKPAPSAMIVGSTSEIENITTGFELEKGRFFTQKDEGKKIIVLDGKIAQDLFGEDDPLGKIIQINSTDFEVVGTIKYKESSDLFGGGEFQSICTMPFETAEDLMGGIQIHRILVKVGEVENIEIVKDELTETILENHGQNKDFSVISQEDLLDFLDDILQILTSLLTAIAAISLVVGGIGIMNIMLVSATERTREIGLRKAVGATRTDILKQFLIEAVTLSFFGGLIGLAFTYGATQIIKLKTPLTPEITWQALVIAIGVAVGVGIIFGIAPAIRAARKDPIEALRYE